MANSRDVRLRMRAITQTLQVTKAMNLISTAKLRKGRRVLEDTVPFFTRIQKTMFDILNTVENVESEFFNTAASPTDSEKSSSKRTAILVVSSDRGLAGGYNINLFNRTMELCKQVQNPVLILIGSVGYRYFINSPYLILETFSFNSRLPQVDDAKQIADFIISQYLWGVFDEIRMVYTYMYSAIKLEPTEQHILPLKIETIQEDLAKTDSSQRKLRQFEYIPSVESVFNSLVPLYIKGIIYGCLVEAYASEQSARMSAMEEATKSAEEMLDTLQLNYNRARQAGITQEVTEIVSGSSAQGDTGLPRNNLSGLIKNAVEKLDAERLLLRGTLETAFPIPDGYVAALKEALKIKYAVEEVVLDIQVVPALYGGCRLLIGSEVWDGSTREQLNHLGSRLKNEGGIEWGI